MEARRTEMRHGGLHIVQQTFKGFTALPAPSGFRKLLGLHPTDSYDAAMVEQLYRTAAKTAHPDTPGGSAERMASLNTA